MENLVYQITNEIKSLDAYVKAMKKVELHKERREDLDNLQLHIDRLKAWAGISDENTSNSIEVKDQEPIDIYSKEGTKVKYTGKGGYDHHKEHANKHLKIGDIYTIDHTDVHAWNTNVYLKEIPNEGFNSVHFIYAE